MKTHIASIVLAVTVTSAIATGQPSTPATIEGQIYSTSQAGALAGAAAGANAQGGNAQGGTGIGGAAQGGSSTQGQGQSSDNLNALQSQQTSTTQVEAGDRSVSTTQVDSSNRSNYNARAVAHAPLIHGAAAAPLASATMMMQPGVCGPRHYLERTPIMGVHHGVFWNSEVQQGFDQVLVAAEQPYTVRDGRIMGHLIHEYVYIVGTSTSKSLSVQGYGSNQQGGGAGAANGGSHQQFAVRYSIRDCEMQVAPAAPVVVAPVVRQVMPARIDRN